jgi:hypothetical protein
MEIVMIRTIVESMIEDLMIAMIDIVAHHLHDTTETDTIVMIVDTKDENLIDSMTDSTDLLEIVIIPAHHLHQVHQVHPVHQQQAMTESDVINNFNRLNDIRSHSSHLDLCSLNKFPGSQIFWILQFSLFLFHITNFALLLPIQLR